jgi:hypothetical protein
MAECLHHGERLVVGLSAPATTRSLQFRSGFPAFQCQNEHLRASCPVVVYTCAAACRQNRNPAIMQRVSADESKRDCHGRLLRGGRTGARGGLAEGLAAVPAIAGRRQDPAQRPVTATSSQSPSRSTTCARRSSTRQTAASVRPTEAPPTVREHSTHARGLLHFREGKRAKSVSDEQSSAPCSMAKAAKCASDVRLPPVPIGSSNSRRIRRCRGPGLRRATQGEAGEAEVRAPDWQSEAGPRYTT